jgi:RNA polymerase sigma factor (sigma-70 family)
MKCRSEEEKKALTALMKKCDRLIKAKAARCLAKGAKFDAALSFYDLYQAGVGGLIEAYDSYDASFSVPFSAHLALRISFAIYNEYTRCCLIRPKISRKRELFEEDAGLLEMIYGRPISNDELAEFLSMSPVCLEKDIAKVKAETPNFVSLSGAEETFGNYCTLAEDPDDPVEAAVQHNEMSGFVRRIMQPLSDKEKAVVIGVYFEGKTLLAVGESFNPPVSKQRVQVIRDNALRRMQRLLPDNFSLQDVFRG